MIFLYYYVASVAILVEKHRTERKAMSVSCVTPVPAEWPLPPPTPCCEWAEAWAEMPLGFIHFHSVTPDGPLLNPATCLMMMMMMTAAHSPAGSRVTSCVPVLTDRTSRSAKMKGRLVLISDLRWTTNVSMSSTAVATVHLSVGAQLFVLSSYILTRVYINQI